MDIETEQRPVATWAKARDRLRELLPSEEFHAWIVPLALEQAELELVTLSVPDRFFAARFAENYLETFRAAWVEVSGRAVSVNLAWGPDMTQREHFSESKAYVPQPQPTGLIDRYEFKNFVVGPGNSFARAAAIAVAQQPGSLYSPFFLYGGTGLGKTHLANAIGHSVRANSPGVRVEFLSADSFASRLLEAIASGTVEFFKRRIRCVDVLILDDVQFLEGRERAQEELFHSFDHLYNTGKQIVLTSDRYPSELVGVADRLCSRFSWGLVADLAPPDLETRIAILEGKVRREGLDISRDAIERIATKLDSNVRDLEGALTRVRALASLQHGSITSGVVDAVLPEFSRKLVPEITLDSVQEGVAVCFGIAADEISLRRRTKRLAEARHVAMYLMRQLAGASYPAIGEHLGGRDQSTVVQAVQSVSKRLNDDAGFREMVDQVARRIGTLRTSRNDSLGIARNASHEEPTPSTCMSYEKVPAASGDTTHGQPIDESSENNVSAPASTIPDTVEDQTMLDAERLWTQACSTIEKQLSEKDFQTWILELGARSFDGETLTLEAPFGLFRDRVEQSFLPTIESSVSATTTKPCRVVIVVGELGLSTAAQRSRAPSKTTTVLLRGAAVLADRPKPMRKKNFDGFLVGEGNRVAYLGARQLAEGSTRERGNPLFLYGGVGLGKTHLLSAIAQSLRDRGKGVLYYQGEDFTRRMVEALQAGRMDAFHREFRSCNALLLDDVQFLAGKRRTQQEFHHVFDLLLQSGKPIALASDRPFDELEHLDTGLRSRFAGGLLANLGPLDRELRLRILKRKLTEAGIHLDDHILDRLAVQLQGSVREVEGLVSRLRAASNHQSLPLDDGVVETMITPYLSRRGPIDLDVVIDTVAWVHGLTRNELLSRDRSSRVAWPRHVAAYLCRKLTAASLPEIGHALGGRNHTSILRSVRSVAERQSRDSGFATNLQQIEKMLGTSPALRGRLNAV